MNFKSVVYLLVVVVGLSSCFTGVESTPKITLDDVKREKVENTPEQLLLSDVSGEPFKAWTEGKEFYVTDNKINLIFGATAMATDSLAGKIIKYNRSNVVVSLTGDSIVEMVFTGNDNREYVYRTGLTVSDLMSRGSIEVPFAIEMSMIDVVRERVKGRSCYVLTSVWYDENDAVSYQCKYVPITITDAMPGNHIYPIKLSFDYTDGHNYRMFVNISDNLKAPRSFATLFSFKDPHLRYPDIEDDVWDKIINGKVAVGMTHDECRLSLGAPSSIDRRPNYNGVSELWLYDNGSYLSFHDGLLQEFRIPSARK